MYFDLNARSASEPPDPGVDAGGEGGGGGGNDMPIWEQAAMYLFIVLGVLFAPVLNQLANGTALPKELVSLPILIGAGVIGFFIIPQIWEKVGAKRDSPLIVRLAVFFQNGVFWQALLGTIFAAAATAGSTTA